MTNLTWFQVECSPLCSISWVVGEEEVENLEEKQCHVEVEEILEENQFSSILSTLTCSSTNLNNFTIGCR